MALEQGSRVGPIGYKTRIMADPATAAQTDVSRPSALPTAKLGNKSHASSNSLLYMDANEYLDNFQEELNKRVDTEIETLVDGMVDLVDLASVSTEFQTFHKR